MITVNIFLNEEFSGGSTDFYLDDKRTLRESVAAKRGRAAVFDGAAVSRGRSGGGWSEVCVANGCDGRVWNGVKREGEGKRGEWACGFRRGYRENVVQMVA